MRGAFLIFCLTVVVGILGMAVYINKIEKKPFSQDMAPDKGFGGKGISLLVTGDVMLGRTVNLMMTKKNDFTYPFAKVKEWLRQQDIVLINLESPISGQCPVRNDGMVFCTDKRSIQGLIGAGITVAGIANNHANNYGLETIKYTTEILRKNGIAVSGTDGPAVITIKGVKVGFLSYNDIGVEEKGIMWADKKRIIKDIKDLEKQVDFVVTSFHWGTEYTDTPNLSQRSLAHLAIESGADIVIGHHPHWIQGSEWYLGKPILYSLGNFIFDQQWSAKTSQGIVAEFNVLNDKVNKMTLRSVIMDKSLQTRWANEMEAIHILDGIKQFY